MLIVDIEATYEIESKFMPGHIGTFRPVTPRERGRYLSMVMKDQIGEMLLQVFEDHIVNFKPLEDAKGNNVVFNKEKHLNSIPFEIQTELGKELLEKNKLNEDEIKNS